MPVTYFLGPPMDERRPNELPEIRIDREGVWYYRDVEMIRTEIVQYFYKHLHRDSQGNYQIELNQEQCSIHVEDAPYVVRSVSAECAGADESQRSMIISLSDGCSEKLDAETIRIGEKDVLYCRVKNKEHEARFSRQAYYQLAEYIEYDPHQDRYFLVIGCCLYALAANLSNENGGNHAGRPS
jgi:uncharacterized protein